MIPAVTTATVAGATVAQSAADAAKAQRLSKAAHQFEAMLLGEMLKPLGKSGEQVVDGSDDGNANPLQSFGVEAIAGTLANSGALGFAKQIQQALQSTKSAAAPPVSADDTPVRQNHTKV